MKIFSCQGLNHQLVPGNEAPKKYKESLSKRFEAPPYAFEMENLDPWGEKPRKRKAVEASLCAITPWYKNSRNNECWVMFCFVG